MDVISSLISAIQLAIQAAPAVEQVIASSKSYIADLVGAGVISAADQDRIHAHIDAYAMAVNAGQEPPEFTVEPNPS